MTQASSMSLMIHQSLSRFQISKPQGSRARGFHRPHPGTRMYDPTSIPTSKHLDETPTLAVGDTSNRLTRPRHKPLKPRGAITVDRRRHLSPTRWDPPHPCRQVVPCPPLTRRGSGLLSLHSQGDQPLHQTGLLLPRLLLGLSHPIQLLLGAPGYRLPIKVLVTNRALFKDTPPLRVL